METSKISFGLKPAAMPRVRKAKTVLNGDVLGNLPRKQKLATTPNSGTRKIVTWDARYRQC